MFLVLTLFNALLLYLFILFLFLYFESHFKNFLEQPVVSLHFYRILNIFVFNNTR